MKWVWVGLASIIYFGLAAFGVLIVAMVHGDCGLEHGAALDACLREKQIVVLVYVVLTLGFYGLMLRRFLRR